MKLQLKAYLAVSLLTTGLILFPLTNDKAATSNAANTVPTMTTTANSTQNDYIAPTYQDILVANVPTYNNQTKALRLNIYKPQNTTEPVPVLVFVHGGGWATGTYAEPTANDTANSTVNNTPTSMSNLPPNTYGDATGQLMANDNRSSLEVFKEVVRHGIALVSVDYRLNSEAAYPDQIYDVKGAVRFIRAHAKEYNIDPNRIAISGTSAGAHLALLLATTNNNPAYEGNVGGNTEYSSAVSAVIDY